VEERTVSAATEIALIERQLTYRDVHDPDFFCFARYAGRQGLFVDVGGNRGQSAVSVRVVWPECTIASFEPNPCVVPALSHIAGRLGNMRVYEFALGATEAEVQFLLPWVDGRPFLEQGTIDPEQFERPWIIDGFAQHGQNVTKTEFRVQARKLDSFGLAPTVMKVDAEGSELAVLQGAQETLRRHKPLLIVENNDWHRVTAFLSDLGYSCLRYMHEDGALVTFFGQITNAFYAHPDSPPPPPIGASRDDSC